jgi:hypothetical protein
VGKREKKGEKGRKREKKGETGRNREKKVRKSDNYSVTVDYPTKC